MKVLTQRAFDLMRSEGRIDWRNGRPHLRLGGAAPPGAAPLEEVEVALSGERAWDWDPAADRVHPWRLVTEPRR
ncbi:MAG TPA: hypothetical protein VNN79_16830 [Actinomycetota bacterium]|nr:hypothetical protein [Actinomycetota bacterium]